MNLILRRMAVRIIAVMFTTLGVAPTLLQKLGVVGGEAMPAWAELIATGVGMLLIGYAQKAKWLGHFGLEDVAPELRASISAPPPPLGVPKPVSDYDAKPSDHASP